MFKLFSRPSAWLKIFIVTVCILGIAFCISGFVRLEAFTFPDPSGYLTDNENILSIDVQLESTLISFEKQSSVEIFVVTTRDFQGSTIEDYSNKLFESWGIGKKDKDNGLLLVVSATQKQSRIEVGYGLEGILTDSKTGRIQDMFLLPFVKEGNYDEGIQSTLEALISEINSSGEYPFTENFNDIYSSTEFAPVLIVFIILIFVFSMSRSWWLGGVAGFVAGIFMGNSIVRGIGYLIFPIPFALLGLVMDFILSILGFGNIMRIIFYSIGFEGRGSSGGGFGGGGGGRSGGGGSSRSW